MGTPGPAIRGWGVVAAPLPHPLPPHVALLRITTVNHRVIPRPCPPAAESAHLCNCLHAAVGQDAIDLSLFSAGPQGSLPIECQTLGVIEPIHVDFKPVDWDFGCSIGSQLLF